MNEPPTCPPKQSVRRGREAPRRRVATLTAAAGVTLAAVAVGLPAVASAPHSTETRTVASAGKTGPGSIVTSSPVTLKSFPGSKAWRITYRSTSATGKPNVVSGTVILPTLATRNPIPIVAYTPGTWGLADRCAPSRNIDSPDPGVSEQVYVKKYTDLGYAVAMTDYEGLGTPGLHTYNVGPSEGHAVLDVVRASLRLPGSGLSPTAPVGVVGYSQGGLASGWTAELAPTYAPEINLKAASVGAPPADLAANLRYLDGAEWAGLVLEAVAGLDAAYPDLHLEKYLNAKGRAAFKKVATQCVDELGTDAAGKKSEWAGHRLSEYTTEDILKRPDWRAKIERSRMGTHVPRVPVLLYNSPNDDIVPYAPAARLRDAWRGRGSDVTFYAPDTGDHGSTGFGMGGVAAGFISARLLGLPPSS